MNLQDVSLGTAEWLTSSASRGRVGVLKIRSAGSAAATPVAKSVTAPRVRKRSAHQPAASTGIQVLSRVNESRTITPIQSASHRRPRSRVSSAAAKARISSASPQLSVSGYEECFTSGGRNTVAAATTAAIVSRKRSRSSPNERQDRRDVARERDVEQRAVAGERVELGGSERNGDPPLVKGLVEANPRRVARSSHGLDVAEHARSAPRIPAASPRRVTRRGSRALAPGSRGRPASNAPSPPNRGQTDRHASAASATATTPIRTLRTSFRVVAERGDRQPPYDQDSWRVGELPGSRILAGRPGASDRPIEGRARTPRAHTIEAWS